jgi:ubiquitin carboxyl-terminal hydrolase 5/13
VKGLKALINAESATYKEELASQAQSWDGNMHIKSKHSKTLLQLPNPPEVSPNPSNWKCEQCDIRQNLWLNLTDGKILCGRRQLDGSGGNNHAIDHGTSKKYPLAVKLGTITAKGADVYSYDEDDMVEDTNLALHLAHFGINMSKMEKTEKTMTELEIDLNQKIGEWDRIQESGSSLTPLFGPGYTGLKNMGNTCYLNSIIQMVFTIPDFIEKYYNHREQYILNGAVDPSNDFNFQLSKLSYGLLSGDYSKEVKNESDLSAKARQGIKPTILKALVGRGHAEFSTKRQQDAHEFFIYFLTLVERNLNSDSVVQSTSPSFNPADAFRFKFEDRIECNQSHHVRYKQRDDFCLSLPIDKQMLINKEEYQSYEEAKKTAGPTDEVNILQFESN